MADGGLPETFRGDLSEVSLELERIGELADDVAQSLTRAFRGAVLEGKSLNSVLGEIGRSLAEIALKAALKPIGDLASGLIETALTAVNPVLQGAGPVATGGKLAAPTYLPALGGDERSQILGHAPGHARQGTPTAAEGARAGVHVTFNVTASDARSFLASEAEVSAMLLRAVRRGQRGS